ncbi:hypothetical protein FQA47_003346 [Oryzias melastigma]|uniref:Uncharacterized protein n=1 Tax=Oryzias melastigma TaxID=30732 RepID=A0A834C4S2_ORYME|nr:hypothetical protein FQA47_003346 [Oryzias melastigma]
MIEGLKEASRIHQVLTLFTKELSDQPRPPPHSLGEAPPLCRLSVKPLASSSQRFEVMCRFYLVLDSMIIYLHSFILSIQTNLFFLYQNHSWCGSGPELLVLCSCCKVQWFPGGAHLQEKQRHGSFSRKFLSTFFSSEVQTETTGDATLSLDHARNVMKELMMNKSVFF